MNDSVYGIMPALRRGVALLLVLAAAPSLWAQGDIKWRSDYNTALKEAQAKNLPMVIDFRRDSCYWCDEMERTTFREPGIVAVMNAKFIPLKINTSLDDKLSSHLGVYAFPTVVLASPDGKILNTLVGYKKAPEFNESLQKIVITVTPPDWMQRDFDLAQKYHAARDYARAIHPLKVIIEDGKDTPVQGQARKLLMDMEKKAEAELDKAKQFQEKGETGKAIEIITDTMRNFPGLTATKDAAELLAKVAAAPDLRAAARLKRAQELLAQAREFYKTKEFVACHDRCELLLAGFGDLPEGQEGALIAAELKNNPESLQMLTDVMTERLGGLYLSLADYLLKRGQPDRAAFYLTRVVQAFPGSRMAESAQIRLDQLQGTGVRPTGVSLTRP